MNVWLTIHQLRHMSVCDFAEKALVRTLGNFVYIDALKCMVLTMHTVDRGILSRKVGYDEKFLSESECLYFAENYDTDMREDDVRGHFAKGDSCYAFLKGHELASYGWYSTSTTKLPSGQIVNFDPTYVYMYQGYTRKTHRGKRLHGIGMARVLKLYCHLDYKGIISMVDARNYESLRSIHRLGYRIFGRIYVIRVGKKFFVWQSVGCKKYGLAVINDGYVR